MAPPCTTRTTLSRRILGVLGVFAQFASFAFAESGPLFEAPPATKASCESQWTEPPVFGAPPCGSTFQPMLGRFGRATGAMSCDPGCQPPSVEATHHANSGDFSPDPLVGDPLPYDACSAQQVYNGKKFVPAQRPWIERGFPLYDNGPVPPSEEWFGPTNLVQQKFYVYGDWRWALAQNDLAVGENTIAAQRLNLDLDYWITSTERVHAFIGPFQEGNSFMRIEDGEFVEAFDFFDENTDTLFFEGDAGQMLGGLERTMAPFDLPVTFGLVPLFFQNGIWMQDALVGGAVTIPAQNSPGLDWSNFDVTFFAGFNHLSSDAFGFDENAANVVGATTFIEAQGGYIEAGYAFLADNEGVGRSYHNLGLSYTRRYLNLLSNSVRCITNVGQDGPRDARSADGMLLLVENSFLTTKPYNVIPYVNFFAGFNRPQPVARAAVFGDVLFNTGILFQSDQLTGYPTLDGTGNNTYGAAAGVDLLSSTFGHQLILETGILQVRGDDALRNAPGAQYGVGARYQIALSKATLIRADVMHGWLEDSGDIAGARVEYRWKF